jgi:hypothetical protein
MGIIFRLLDAFGDWLHELTRPDTPGKCRDCGKPLPGAQVDCGECLERLDW